MENQPTAQKKPLQVGITGGIGSGKTTVSRLFAALGIPIYSADDRAKWLMVNDQALVAGVKALFGEAAYLSDGSLHRAHLASIVFRDAALLDALNALVHPAVHADAARWAAQFPHTPYTLREAALTFESGGYRFLDKIIVVTAPLELRVARVMERDGVGRQAVLDRIHKQMPDEQKVKRADWVVVNDGQHALLHQVWKIHQALCGLAG